MMIGWFRRVIINKLLRRYLKRGLSYLSGPLDGKKSQITLGLLVILVVARQATGAGTIADVLTVLTQLISELGDVRVDQATDVTLAAFVTALVHRFLKKAGEPEEELEEEEEKGAV